MAFQQRLSSLGALRTGVNSFRGAMPVVQAHLLPRRMASSDAASATTSPVTEGHVPSKAAGSYHWAYERGLSVVSVPLIVTAISLPDTSPLVDMGLAAVLTAHTHIGFDAILTDYLPKRRAGSLGTVATWTLRFASILTLYGLYTFNTNDVGITEFCRRLWAGKPHGFVMSEVDK